MPLSHKDMGWSMSVEFPDHTHLLCKFNIKKMSVTEEYVLWEQIISSKIRSHF